MPGPPPVMITVAAWLRIRVATRHQPAEFARHVVVVAVRGQARRDARAALQLGVGRGALGGSTRARQAALRGGGFLDAGAAEHDDGMLDAGGLQQQSRA